ncbi:hypothetical protein FJZ17_00310 [Candidatus Pacearchaeota archaeon]|nr:hypothetical protein [Candidatus Pacearchaeota archaeon]
MPEQTSQDVRTFLAEQVYLPGYMLLGNHEQHDAQGSNFSFNVREPPVARESILHYLTPRGLHICLSQAGYAMVERMVSQGAFGEMNLEKLRQTLLSGRIKIKRIYEDFKREVDLAGIVEARFDIVAFRAGRLPLLKIGFNFNNRAIGGFFVSTIVPTPTAQLNSDVSRI